MDNKRQKAKQAKDQLVRELIRKEIAKITQQLGEGFSRMDYVQHTTKLPSSARDQIKQFISRLGLKALRGYITPSGRSLVLEYDSPHVSMMDRPNKADRERIMQMIAHDVPKLKGAGIGFAQSGLRVVCTIKDTGIQPVSEASTDRQGSITASTPKQAAKSEPSSAPKVSAPPAKPQPKAAPKQQPEKPENKPQPDQQEKPQDTDAELASMTAGFIQKIKHSVGSPTPESLTTMITSLIQAWGLTSEDKLAILKTVRNTTVR